MPRIPFRRVVSLLEASGYKIHHRTKYPDREEAYFYFFVHPESGHPAVGFPVRSKLVQQRYYDLIFETLKRSDNDENEESSGD